MAKELSIGKTIWYLDTRSSYILSFQSCGLYGCSQAKFRAEWNMDRRKQSTEGQSGMVRASMGPRTHRVSARMD